MPKPQPMLVGGAHDLDAPDEFVARGNELALLQRRWLEAKDAPVAVIEGPRGCGKTTLAAEVIHLWHRSFDYVFAFQSRSALSIEEFHRQLDRRLGFASPAYQERAAKNRREAIYFEPDDLIPEEDRYEQLRNNLVDALRRERMLLVLDDFETNLRSTPSERGFECLDPRWDELFEVLADRLGRWGSRVLVLSQHKPVVLNSRGVLCVPLGPLSSQMAGDGSATGPLRLP